MTGSLVKTSGEFMERVRQMVTDQAPQLFAVVIEYGEEVDAEVIAWGMTLDEGAFMITVDGRNQYALAEPENALCYVRGRTNTTPHLVWVGEKED